MKILLVVPPFVEEGVEMACKESIGVCYLAAVLRRHGFEVTLLDADLLGLTTDQTVQEICRCQAAIIGFSVLEGTIESTESILRGLAQKGISGHIVLGGTFPTLVAEETLQRLQGVQSVIIGEGELTLLELAQCIANGGNWRNIKGLAYRQHDGSVVINETRGTVGLDELPFPARDLLPEVLKRGGVAGIVGSRGCFAHCSFCCIRNFNTNCGITAWRGRSPANIVDEIEYLVTQWGISIVSFYDSIFIGPGQAGMERAYKIAEEIIKRGVEIQFGISVRADQVDKALFRYLKKAGLIEVFIGLETMSQESLDLYHKALTVEDNLKAVKILEELKIFFRPGFILYEPYITLEQIRENIRLLWKLLQNPFCSKFHFFKALRVYRGSPLEKTFLADNILIRHGWHNAYTWQKPLIEKFTYLTGLAGVKMLPLIERIGAFESEAQKYLDHLLGQWSLETYEKILDRLQVKGDVEQDEYLEIILRAESKLHKIRRIIEHYENRTTT